MHAKDELLVRISTSPASDSWGFVGVVSVGEHEAYRTIRAHAAPAGALASTQHLLAGVLASLMAGQEWKLAQTEFGHPPRRTELEFGLPAGSGHRGSSQVPAEELRS